MTAFFLRLLTVITIRGRHNLSGPPTTRQHNNATTLNAKDKLVIMEQTNFSLRTVTETEVKQVAKKIMGRKTSNNQFTFDRRFRELFGCGSAIVVRAWNEIEEVIEWTGLEDHDTRKIDYLLWALLFLKVYGKESTLCILVGGVDEKTYRKWVSLYVAALSSLESFIVSTR